MPELTICGPFLDPDCSIFATIEEGKIGLNGIYDFVVAVAVVRVAVSVADREHCEG